MYSQGGSRKKSGTYKSLYIAKKGKPKGDEKRLRRAASINDCDRVKELLESGVNPNASDENGRTALHLASAIGYSNVVKILLAHKADCNVVDKLGNTPLHLAVCTTSTATVNLLLNAGCSTFQKGHNGCTPLRLAQTKLCLLQKYCSSDYNDIKSKISEIIESMKLMMNNENQEKKLAELFSSGLLLNESSNLTAGVNNLLKTLKELQL